MEQQTFSNVNGGRRPSITLSSSFSLSKHHLHCFLRAFSLCSGRVCSDLPGHFSRNLHLEWDSFLSPVSSWTPLLLPPVISLANAPVVLCRTLQSMAMVSCAIWDDLTACLCVYLAGLENENSFNPLICSQHQAGKHSLECKFWASQGALMKRPAAGQCGPSSPPAPARRVHACFRKSTLHSGGNHLHPRAESTRGKYRRGVIFPSLGVHISVDN